MLEAKDSGKCQLKGVTTVKSKKGRIRKVEFRVTVLLNPDHIDEVHRIAGNTKWQIVFELECRK